ncbi:DUF6093 family protein [Brevibacterium pigmentatum]|uniref:DUF6093 family protein n=1 Tax=Brevibacterium pigmentatum TaxID=1496080 RepID=UPI0014238E7D|nr:DUF6093 family protein [Brevibacterium pigmentatum]
MDAGALLAGRARAEQMMKDQCIIRRVAGEVTDRETGKVVPAYVDVYTGRCKLQSYEGYEQEKNTAGTALTVQRMSVHLPVGAYRINVGDFVEITDSRLDPLLVGRKFRITQEAPFKTFATAYRVFVDYIAD